MGRQAGGGDDELARTYLGEGPVEQVAALFAGGSVVGAAFYTADELRHSSGAIELEARPFTAIWSNGLHVNTQSARLTLDEIEAPSLARHL